MPNRKTFDEREKYDHSGHPLRERQPSDLQADIQNEEDRVVKVTDPVPKRRTKSPAPNSREASRGAKRP
jgi:hypothetical protein